MKDDAIDRLSRANPVPDELPPLEYAAVRERVRQRTEHAGRGRPHPERSFTRRLGHGLSLAIPVAVVGLVAALVLVIGNHHTPTTHGDARRAFSGTLAVISEAQSDAEGSLSRLPADGIGKGHCETRHPEPACSLHLERSLVQAVPVGRGHDAIISPVRVARTTALARAGQAVELSLLDPVTGDRLSCCSRPTSLARVRSHGIVVAGAVGVGVDRGAILVPDGVAKVTVSHLRVSKRPGLAPSVEVSRPVVIRAAPVRHNIAALTIVGLTPRNLHLGRRAQTAFITKAFGGGCGTTQMFGVPATAEMAWRDATGRIVGHTKTSFRLNFASSRQSCRRTP